MFKNYLISEATSISIGIYKIENLITRKVYIGQSVHIEKRWREHCSISKKSLISKSIQKYGKENFSFQILEECLESELDEKEIYYIKQYNSVSPNGYNIIDYINGKRQVYKNYDSEILKSIISDIKNVSIPFSDIAYNYSLDLSMVYYLNRGDCHTLENENYPLRPVKDFTKKIRLCVDCGIEIGKGAKRCIECSQKAQQVCERPSRKVLKSLIRNNTFVSIGKKYGVSDNAIRNWCKKENLPFKKTEIKSYSDEEWSKI